MFVEKRTFPAWKMILRWLLNVVPDIDVKGRKVGLFGVYGVVVSIVTF